MDRLDKSTLKVLNNMGRNLIVVSQEISRGMFELEPNQEMFDLLFEIGQKITKVQTDLRDLIGYIE